MALLAPVYTMILVSDFSFIHYLVHIATAGIEADESLAWQRPGRFPNHQLEGYFTHRCVAAAAALLVLAAGLIVVFARARRIKKRLTLGAAIIGIGAGQAVFLWWYYRVELPRISPDLAAGGWCFTTQDLAGGVALLLIAALWMACLLTRSRDESAESVWPMPRPFGVLPIWLAAIGLACGGGGPAARHVVDALSDTSAYFATTFWEALPLAVRSLLLSPQFMMLLALGLSGLQLARSAWRHQQMEVHRLPGRRTAATFTMLALIGLVGAPTLAAYSFGSWFGPWWK